MAVFPGDMAVQPEKDMFKINRRTLLGLAKGQEKTMRPFAQAGQAQLYPGLGRAGLARAVWRIGQKSDHCRPA